MATRPSVRAEFEIAIVCALPLEFDAVSLVVDKFWDETGDQYGRAVGDQNTYRTGRIGNCNSVLVLLSGMGKASAANAATSLRSSYPGLRLVLVTGICGGVPSPGTKKEILLGDVVVSKTMVQYDLGRLYADDFAMKDTVEERLGRPTKNIRNLVAVLETELERERLEQRAAILLREIQDAASRKRRRANYQHPGVAQDKLFQPDYQHKHRLSPECVCVDHHEASDPVCEESRHLSCEVVGCDDSYLVRRESAEIKRRMEREGRGEEAQAPSVFVGRIGSGDSVVKCGEERDRIAKRHGIMAFEMAGAGVWDEVPCIVIKGVCDYADSHRNKRWRDFAAATAASVTKALLERYTRTDKPSSSIGSSGGKQVAPSSGSVFYGNISGNNVVSGIHTSGGTTSITFN